MIAFGRKDRFLKAFGSRQRIELRVNESFHRRLIELWNEFAVERLGDGVCLGRSPKFVPGVVSIIQLGDGLLLRLMALMMLMAGALLLSLASILWSFSQSGGEACSPFRFKLEAMMMRAKRLDEVLMAIPLLVFFAGCFVVAAVAIYLTFATSPFSRGVILATGAFFLFWTAWMIAGTSRFLYTQAREQAEAAARARSEASEAQLAALQAQMNPHFLFNALNTVASLVKTDPEAAEVTVENLSVVLRRTLERSSRPITTVDDEVDYLAAYLSVAKKRFERRLQVDWSIDPATRDLLLPTMTLQPLVENALKHGIGAQLEGGALHIGAHVDNGEAGRKLVLEVADDGPGFPPRYEEGTGLQNLRARLDTLFGDDASLRVKNGGPGSRVIIEIPAVEDADEVLAAAFSRTPDLGATEPLTDENLSRFAEEFRNSVRKLASDYKSRLQLGGIADLGDMSGLDDLGDMSDQDDLGDMGDSEDLGDTGDFGDLGDPGDLGKRMGAVGERLESHMRAKSAKLERRMAHAMARVEARVAKWERRAAQWAENKETTRPEDSDPEEDR